ncbi:MAG: hypothetical protein U0231_02685 [Nitrospiraceae bacterium]
MIRRKLTDRSFWGYALAVSAAALCALIVSPASGRIIEVVLSVQNGKVSAITPTSGTREISLGVGETVLSATARGMNGIVVSSSRLLAFSSETMTWNEQSLDISEQVLDRRVHGTFSLIRTNQRLHAFRATLGRWVEERLGPNETVKATKGAGHLIAVVTNERVLGFSAFAGDSSRKTCRAMKRFLPWTGKRT